MCVCVCVLAVTMQQVHTQTHCRDSDRAQVKVPEVTEESRFLAAADGHKWLFLAWSTAGPLIYWVDWWSTGLLLVYWSATLLVYWSTGLLQLYWPTSLPV